MDEGASRRTAATHLIAASPTGAGEERSARDRRLVETTLEAKPVVKLLGKLGVARFDAETLRDDPTRIDAAQRWIAVAHLSSREPGGPLPARAEDLARRLRDDGEVPEDYVVLDELRRRLAAGGRIPVKSLSHANRLRLLQPTSTRPVVQRFVRHVQAFLDGPNLERAWHDAPDVFFTRLPTYGDAELELLASLVGDTQ